MGHHHPIHQYLAGIEPNTHAPTYRSLADGLNELVAGYRAAVDAGLIEDKFQGGAPPANVSTSDDVASQSETSHPETAKRKTKGGPPAGGRGGRKAAPPA